ncbi:MAG: ABC transporter substrate-binding protein [Candidatus Devosia euplotis]|nr:ABC transporter substrate-binding protein [Candidatus Devosia euplotis]
MRGDTTIMLRHGQIYLSYLYGVPGNDDPFANFVIGPTTAINPGDSFLVPTSSPYQPMEAILKAAEACTKVRVAIQSGGVSEIGFTAMRNAARVCAPGSEANIVAVNTGSQGEANKAVWDGLADVINGSIQANKQFTQLPADDAKAMRFVWIAARQTTPAQAPEAGMGNATRADFMQYASPTTSVTLDSTEDFAFDKEFFLLYNKDMDPALMGIIDTTLAEIYAEGAIEKKQAAFFIPNFPPRDEALAHLSAKRDRISGIIDQFKTQ